MTKLISSAKNLKGVRELNLSTIFKLLIKADVCSRADLAKHTGLRQSTITNIINELIEYGLVSEVGSIEGLNGRRSIGITFNGHVFNIISIRLTRNTFIVGRYDMKGVERAIITHSISGNVPVNDTLVEIEKCVDTLIRSSDKKIIGIGIAIPGPLHIKKEQVILMTGTSGWENINIREYFKQKFDMPVFIEHDANAGALAEWWFGKDNFDLGTFVYIAAGQGIGAGVMIDGKILHGDMGVAGEIGHMSIQYDGPKCQCGNYGCLENYCSAVTLINAINAGIKQGVSTSIKEVAACDQIVEAAHKGDRFVLESAERIFYYLAIGLTNLVNIYNPSTIIIGDELAEFGDILMETVSKTIKSRILPELYEPLTIRFASFQRDPALIGSVALVIDEILRKPTDILIKAE